MVIKQFVPNTTANYSDIEENIENILNARVMIYEDLQKEILGDHLGRGCHGAVYEHKNDITRAVKAMRLSRNVRALAFLKRCQHMNHPNLPKVHEFIHVTTPGHSDTYDVYVVMDRLKHLPDPTRFSDQYLPNWFSSMYIAEKQGISKEQAVKELWLIEKEKEEYDVRREILNELFDGLLEDIAQISLSMYYKGHPVGHLDLHNDNIMLDENNTLILNDPVIY